MGLNDGALRDILEDTKVMHETEILNKVIAAINDEEIGNLVDGRQPPPPRR